ncbi:hypothetical protein BX600DRAFT_389001 [Xylariales sp. PMI_506]|nr:hypothetical protein BX600DRAFT_389001 [Xylariales sp. PMI_506]
MSTGAHQIDETSLPSQPCVLPQAASLEPRPFARQQDYSSQGRSDNHERLTWPQRWSNNGPGNVRRVEQTSPRLVQVPVYEDGYDSQIVDLLDVVDPEVSTLSSITNVQNSLFVPSLGRFINRRPTYNLTPFPTSTGNRMQPADTAPTQPCDEEGKGRLEIPPSDSSSQSRPAIRRIPSTMTEQFFAVRPNEVSFADWTPEDLAELDDHVRHMLHSRGHAFRRRLRAFRQYCRTPLGFFVTLYATLITLFGLAWVLFLIGWIYVGERQLYVINVIDNVLVALFAVVGDGLIPWRIVDTYHMSFIAHYHHLTWKLRDRMQIPTLRDKNDLPSETISPDIEGTDGVDLEAARDVFASKALSVLTPRQQAKLDHHQRCFSKSHTFYKPHETETHYAFPLRLLVAVVVLLDLHSCFQIALGLCTWCIDYHVRPMALTATILSCSITVNTLAGILISIGDRKTRKKDVIERIFRQDLTREAIRKVQKRKEEEDKPNSKRLDTIPDIEER